MINAIFFAVQKLKDFVSDHSKKNCSYDGTTIGDDLKISVNYVPLQVEEYHQNYDSDKAGHLHTRKEIINKSKSSTSTNIQLKDFFQRSVQLIRKTAEYKNAINDEAKEKVLKEKGNVVGIIGQAGVEKSTLMKHLLYRNVTDERLYKADCIFYVKLRDFFNKTEINLFQFLVGNIAYNNFPEWMKDSAIRNEVLKLL